MKPVYERFIENPDFTKSEFVELIKCAEDPEAVRRLKEEAVRIREIYYGKKVFTRGLIEYTNYCKNDCYYCGIRKSNTNAKRYRLTEDEIMACCENGYELGFRTFVLQGGEDAYYTDDRMVAIIKKIKEAYPECALTLSIGEKSYESYKRFREAGADRYLLRHETANEEHYRKLHPEKMSLAVRKNCLYDLKKLGYQVGAGMMVGSPYQTTEDLAEDLVFLEGIAAGDGGDRTVYPTPRYAVCKRTGRKCGDDTVFARCDPDSAAEGTSSGDNSTWYDGSTRQGKRSASRGECCDAEPFSGEEPEAV